MSKVLFVLNAVVVAVFGLVLFFVPETGLVQFGLTDRVQEVYTARVVGVALVSLAVLLWFAKDADEALQKKFVVAALIGCVLSLVVTVMGYIPGDNGVILKGYGWLAIVVEVVFALGYAFVLFLQPRMK